MNRISKWLVCVATALGPLGPVACGGSDGTGGKPSPSNPSGSGGNSSQSGSGGSSSAGSDTGGSTAPATGGGTVSCNAANIVGTWQATNTGAVTVDLTYASNGTYEIYIFAAGAAAGTFDVEEETGTYTVAGGIATLTPTAISCPAAASGSVNTCTISDGDTVLVNTQTGAGSAWSPTTSPSLGNTTIGCFANNEFSAYPLTKIP